jgi:NDP-sugar pyrophosphorylase family protein
VALHEHVHTVPFGVVELEGSRVVDIREKPTHVWLANCGIYVLDPTVVDRVPRGTPLDLPVLVEECLSRNEPVGGFLVEDEWIDIGRHRELERARGGRGP